jgi:hypothetical protein
MKNQQWNLCLIWTVLFVGCATVTTPPPSSSENVAVVDVAPAAQNAKAQPGSEYYLICKAKKSRFHFDWTAAASDRDQIDQNSVRYKFRSANRPAGEKGENLKVGECGWAGRALANGGKENSEFMAKSLSDEATQTFYKIRTGKVFKLPVRHGKSGLVVLPKSEVRVIR